MDLNEAILICPPTDFLWRRAKKVGPLPCSRTATSSLPEPTAAEILDLGCGNAKLSEELFDHGYRRVTGLDISPVAIDSMRERNAERRPEIRWAGGP